MSLLKHDGSPTTHTLSSARVEGDDYTRVLEALRREPSGSLDTLPRAPLQYEVRDYADAGLRIEAGAAHLRESLPGGQLLRTVAAYTLLRHGTEDLGRWLRARGVGV